MCFGLSGNIILTPLRVINKKIRIFIYNKIGVIKYAFLGMKIERKLEILSFRVIRASILGYFNYLIFLLLLPHHQHIKILFQGQITLLVTKNI